jgi:hypothetical protein
VGWLLDVEMILPIADGHARLDYTFDFSVTQPFKIKAKPCEASSIFADFMTVK